METPILVTGAAGSVGAVGRTVTELLLAQSKAVRAMVRSDDERAQSLRNMGAEVVIGDLLDLESMHRAVAGCETMYFGMSVSDDYLAATVNAAAVAKHHGMKAFVNMSQMSITETTPCPQHQLHWLAEQALNWSSLPVIHVRPTVFMENVFLLFAADSIRDFDEIRLLLGDGETSLVAVDDVARVIAMLLANPQPHIGKVYHLTGPQSENMDFYAEEYSQALGRRITYRDIPVGAWREGLSQRGLQIEDGTSNTILYAEKYLNSFFFESRGSPAGTIGRRGTVAPIMKRSPEFIVMNKLTIVASVQQMEPSRSSWPMSFGKSQVQEWFVLRLSRQSPLVRRGRAARFLRKDIEIERAVVDVPIAPRVEVAALGIVFGRGGLIASGRFNLRIFVPFIEARDHHQSAARGVEMGERGLTNHLSKEVALF